MAAADRSTPASANLRFLQLALLFAVAGFAWFRFSDNTVDNDLWGHVLYGQRYWNEGRVRGPEMFSWTASGFEVVNHEYLAEIVMGWVHRIAGGTGLWVYMLVMGCTTAGLALRFGRRASSAPTPRWNPHSVPVDSNPAPKERPTEHQFADPAGAQKWAAVLLFAGSINFIALGFAVRPQLFTTLFLVVELWLLRELCRGRVAWGFWLLPLFALWGNFHGGVLAGILVFFSMAAAETLHAFSPRPLPVAWEATRPPRQNLRGYWLLLPPAAAALLLNPWGSRLVAWNIAATLRPRPQIHEWHWTNFSAANAPFYIVLAISLLAWSCSRRPKKLGEAAILLLLAAVGVLHRRHLPLFGLANLIFSSPHVADLAAQIAPHAQDLVRAFRRPLVQVAAGLALTIAGAASLFASFAAPREKPWTMEVEKSVFPIAATEFIQSHELFGKTITFFDWGQQNLWELPHNPVSFDGRFDTGYPADVIAAHWQLYDGVALSPLVKWSDADVALLPTASGGVRLLSAAGWRSVYRDHLASVLVSPQGRYAQMLPGPPLVRRREDALRGRVPFPDTPPLLATEAPENR